MLGRLEFRGIGRQELQADAVGDLQVLGDMPAGAIEDEHDDLVRPMSRANAARFLLNIAVFTASARNQTTAPVAGRTKPKTSTHWAQ